MRAKLQGLFRALPGPETHPPDGVDSTSTPSLWLSVTMKLSSRGFSSIARPRDTSLWRGEGPPRRPSLWLSVTMRAKLQGLFERCQAQIHHHPGGVKSNPDAPHSVCRSRWELSSRAFRALPGPDTHHPGGVKSTPTHLTLVSVRMKLSSWGFSSVGQCPETHHPHGWIPPRCPSLWLLVTVRAKLQGLFWALPGPGTHHPGGVKVHPNNRKISYEWSKHHIWLYSPISNSKIQHYQVTALTYLTGPT